LQRCVYVDAEDAVAALETRLAQAIATCDAAACAAVLSDEFTAVRVASDRSLGVVLHGDWLRAVGTCESRQHTVDDVSVSLHGDLAVATVLWTDGEGATAQQFLVTDVWRSSAGDWRLLERHIGKPDTIT
jgi:ketosteroid isomerase-like protein